MDDFFFQETVLLHISCDNYNSPPTPKVYASVRESSR